MILAGAFSVLVSAPESRLTAADGEQDKKEKRRALLKKKLEEAKKAEEAKRAEEARLAEQNKKAYDAKPSSPPVPSPVVPEKARDAKSLAGLIDAEIHKSLLAAKIVPSERSSDAEFLRRVYLDIAGVIPTPEQAVSFLDSTDAKKREKLIDELLESKNYGRRLSDIWVGLMNPVDSDNRFVDKQPLAKWLTDQFNDNVGWDKLVKTVLTATGDQDEHGEVTYYMANRGVDKITDSVGKLFLGIQLQCAQCHNHPFTSWKQDEYWGMAQFFYKVNAIVVNPKKADTKMDQVSETGRVNRKMNPLPESAKNVPARFLGAGEVKLSPNQPYRPVLAEWVVSPKNPYFAKAMVNRMWAMLMGRGFVHPVDDMLPENQPSHPELLNELTGEFIASGFDLKHLVRAICNSDAYQRTSKPTASNKSDERFYSRQAMKTLSPEQLYDSILLALGTSQENARGKAANPAVKGRITPRDQFALFFQPGEETRPTEYDAGIPQVLRLMNASRFNASPALARELARTKPDEALEKVYLRILSRRPTEEESTRLKAFIAQEGERSYADIIWALVNSSEFALNR